MYFDSQAVMIRKADVRPAHVFIGSPPDIRVAVLTLDLKVPAYIDAGETVFGTLLDQKILPAVVLVDKAGRALGPLYGGGESLDGNIRTLLAGEKEGGRRWWLILIPVAVLAILPFVID